MEFGESDEVGQACHRAVVIQDLTNYRGRNQSGQARDVDRSFGVSGAGQDATVAGHQREDMAGGDDVVGPLGGVNGDQYRARPVMGGYSRGNPVFGLDGDGECGLVPRLIVRRHWPEIEPFCPLGRDRQTDQAASVLRHEIHGVRRCELGGDDEVAFVLAIFGIDEDIDASLPSLFDDLFDRRDMSMERVVRHG